MNKPFAIVCLLSFVLGCKTPDKDRSRNPKRPNFVVLLADDQAWSGTSVQMDNADPLSKSDYYETPNLELLAKMGTKFSRGYSASPVCSPTRYSIQFGQTPTRLKRTVVGNHQGPKIRHDTLLSIPRLLTLIDTNYYAAHFGKWHMEMLPNALGYDESDGFTTNREGGYFTLKEHDTVEIRKDPKLTNSLSYRGADYIERMVKWNRPFYLQISYYANHTYVTASEEHLKKYQNKPKGKIHNNPFIGAMTEDLDAGIGIILNKIKALGLEDNTYIVYMADNGSISSFYPTTPTDITLNFPLNGGKWDVHEGGIRIPFIMAGPKIPKGKQIDAPVISYDILPTIAKRIAPGFQLPPYLDGGDILEAIKGKVAQVTRPNSGLVFDYPNTQNWEMLKPGRAWIENDLKLIYSLRDSTYSLYDLDTDPSEEKILDTAKFHEEYSVLQNKLSEYLKSVK
ncbi:MAG: sulfatase-like hydrolase/transferase [Bacteroidota bacterium]